jgi:hypothetical protein
MKHLPGLYWYQMSVARTNRKQQQTEDCEYMQQRRSATYIGSNNSNTDHRAYRTATHVAAAAEAEAVAASSLHVIIARLVKSNDVHL